MPIGRWGVERQASGLPGVNSWNEGGSARSTFFVHGRNRLKLLISRGLQP